MQNPHTTAIQKDNLVLLVILLCYSAISIDYRIEIGFKSLA